MGLTEERAEAAKGQMLAYIRDSVDRWNERTAQEQADAAAATKRRRFKDEAPSCSG